LNNIKYRHLGRFEENLSEQRRKCNLMRCLSEFFAFFEQRFEISGICDGSFMMLDARINSIHIKHPTSSIKHPASSIKHRLVRMMGF